MTEYQRRLRLKLHDWLGVVMVLGLLAMLFSLLQDWLRVEQKLLDAAEIREVLVAQIRELEAQKNEGPRHTACDTKQILDDLRQGQVAPHYQVEDRCR